MNESSNQMSICLYKILDIIGASEEERMKYWENAITDEIFYAAYFNQNMTREYRFGSSFEGTTTVGLQSDHDALFTNERYPVIENIQQAPQYGVSCLMINDYTKPGYVYLQWVYNGVPQTIYHREINASTEDTDQYGRICLKHIPLTVPGYSERSGPARTKKAKGIGKDSDVVIALTSRKIPSFANSWFQNTRLCNWQTRTQLHKMASYGCFFVGVGHPNSKEKSMEWRISFSLQEKELMYNLNPTQHKCYILLKMIKKDIIQSMVGEKSISSYHCKTCLFHVIETSRPGFWTRKNLIQGVRVCLSVLLSWVKKGNCPNYFIPEENMFDRLNRDILDKVAGAISDVLRRGSQFLLSLKCDRIGYLIPIYMAGVKSTVIRNLIPKYPEELLFFDTSRTLYFSRNSFLETVNVSEPTRCLRETLSILQRITRVELNGYYTPTDISNVVQSFLPHIFLQIAQSIASVFAKCRGKGYSMTMINAFVYSIKKSGNIDLISSKLSLATCYLRSNMLQKCEEILLLCETLVEKFVVSICGCYEDGNCYCQNESLSQFLHKSKLSSTDFRRRCTTGCMFFLPGQAVLVHPALQLEMYRSMLTPPGSRCSVRDFWFDFILVDSRIYLYFLQYILYSKTNNHEAQKNAIYNMLHLIKNDKNLGHRETALNLLGWIYSKENAIHLAKRCFVESWRIRPVHNAAKWHLAVLLATADR